MHFAKLTPTALEDLGFTDRRKRSLYKFYNIYTLEETQQIIKENPYTCIIRAKTRQST